LGGPELSKSFISLLEKDRTRPSVDTLALIAQRLDTSVGTLLGQEGHVPELIATSILTLTPQLIRNREYARASTMLAFVEFLASTYGLEAIKTERQVQAGQLALEQGAFAEAWEMAEVARRRSEEAKDPWRFGRALLVMGWVKIRQREFIEAAKLFEDALVVLRRARAGRDRARIEALIGLGTSLTRLDRYEAAMRRYEEAASSEVAAHDAVLRGQAWWGKGVVQRTMGDFAAAQESLVRAKEAFESAEELTEMVRVLHNLGQLLFYEGRGKEALRHFHQALRVMERLEHQRDRASILTEIARVHLSLGNLTEVDHFIHQALEVAERVGDPVEVAEAQVILARLLSRNMNEAAAITALKDAVGTFQTRGMRAKMAEAARELGLLLRSRGAHAEAADYLTLAATARDERSRAPVTVAEP
jgi:tetratricopeptide (TPR) repeat protein